MLQKVQVNFISSPYIDRNEKRSDPKYFQQFSSTGFIAQCISPGIYYKTFDCIVAIRKVIVDTLTLLNGIIKAIVPLAVTNGLYRPVTMQQGNMSIGHLSRVWLVSQWFAEGRRRKGLSATLGRSNAGVFRHERRDKAAHDAYERISGCLTACEDLPFARPSRLRD